MKMTDSEAKISPSGKAFTQEGKIEIENENDETEEVKSEEIKSDEPKNEVSTSKLTITKKKVSELNDKERAQLIEDAKNGIENDFFNVKFNKNGTTRITLKRKTKAQEIIDEQKDEIVQPAKTQAKKYLTNDQLLMEHVINLETMYSQLRNKHKKLKKRYNELESYLYTDNDENEEQPQQQNQPQPQPSIQQQPSIQPSIQGPTVQRRFVKSWRQIQPR